jgi:hypothetical protein
MQTFLTLIGLVACVSGLMFAIIKLLEAVWFFKEFRDSVTKSLTIIDEQLRNIKQP